MTFKEALKESNMTIPEAAKHCDVTTRCIYNWILEKPKARRVYINLLLSKSLSTLNKE